MRIVKFEPKYRDDLIFMILEAKNALGRVPGLNEDLLDIQKNYIDKGDMFWIALDDNDRVIGSVGYNLVWMDQEGFSGVYGINFPFFINNPLSCHNVMDQGILSDVWTV